MLVSCAKSEFGSATGSGPRCALRLRSSGHSEIGGSPTSERRTASLRDKAKRCRATALQITPSRRDRCLTRIFHHVFRVGGCFLALAASDFAFSTRNSDRYAFAENAHRPCQAKKSPRRQFQCVCLVSDKNSCNSS